MVNEDFVMSVIFLRDSIDLGSRHSVWRSRQSRRIDGRPEELQPRPRVWRCENAEGLWFVRSARLQRFASFPCSLIELERLYMMLHRLVLVTILLLCPFSIHAWTSPGLAPLRRWLDSRLPALATPPADKSSRSAIEENDNRFQKKTHHNTPANGRVLEGGQVIDFSSVKASSSAEQALAEARSRVINGTALLIDQGSILGISNEVEKLVGYDLGAFCSRQEIQDTARWLRSQAKPGILSIASDPIDWTPSQTRRYQDILIRAYFESGEVTGAFAKTFYMATMLLSQAAREAIWAVYVWCRRTDEIVDAPRDNSSSMLDELASWEMRLERLWTHGEVQDVFDLPLLDLRLKYPNMDIGPYMDMIRGMLMDVPELGQDRYQSFDELHLYCYRVAGTVGLMSLPIFGCAPGYDYETSRYVVCVCGKDALR